MRFRTVALALALAFGLGTMADAKTRHKTVIHKASRKAKKHKAPKRPTTKHPKHV
jgi:hypothetical protein